MPLTDTHIRNRKPAAKSFKLSDGGGMYLLVTPDGARYWRLDYRFAGKRRTLALGVYPTLTLVRALGHAAKKRGVFLPTRSILALPRRPGNVLRGLLVRTHLRPSRANGSETAQKARSEVQRTATCQA